MKAIITRPNEDGSYDEVGMNNRYLVSHYKTKRGLLRYGIAKHYKGKVRIEIWYGDNIYKEVNETLYIERI